MLPVERRVGVGLAPALDAREAGDEPIVLSEPLGVGGVPGWFRLGHPGIPTATVVSPFADYIPCATRGPGFSCQSKRPLEAQVQVA